MVCYLVWNYMVYGMVGSAVNMVFYGFLWFDKVWHGAYGLIWVGWILVSFVELCNWFGTLLGPTARKKISLTEGNGKCRHLKNNLWSDFAAGVCNRPRAPYPPLRLTHCVRVYSILIHTGKGGRVEPERMGEGQQFTKLGRKYQHDWLYLQSINSDFTPAFTG